MPAALKFANAEVRPAERLLLVDGQPAALGGRAFDLLLALLERRDRMVPKAELFDLVWPGVVVEENNLQVQVSALRKLLGAQAIATVAGRGYRFALPVDDGATAAPAATTAADPWAGADPMRAVTYLFSDVEGSTRLWEQHPQAMQAAMAQHDAVSRDCVARHGGRVVKLTGDGIHAVFLDASAAVQAAVALQLRLAAIEPQSPPLRLRIGLHRGVAEYRDGDFYGSAVNRAARVSNAAHGGQILVSQAVVDAVGTPLPAGVTLRDLGAVRLRDLASAERVHQVLHAQLRTDFPPLRSLEATPNNLPQQLNSFVGREHALAEVHDLLEQHRLVTLLAMGGIGKSRLAVQAGAQLMDRFVDGVWLVELAPVTDPQAVPQALATVLGVREEPGASLADALLRHLRDRSVLLLLDNCEHLVDACARLARSLLQGSAGVKILATSRDPLHIGGEVSYPLQPLAVPSAGEAAPEALLRHEAVQLFVDRARAALPAFALDAGNAAAVAEICGRLDGIALAIELAAARVRVLSPQAIAGRLDQRFKLLVGGDRTALPRQQTLRALIDWSYELLPPEEAALFARLAVFATAWTLEAAEQVCSFGELQEHDTLLLLAGLVQKSLVVLDSDGGRYRMLETVHAFAQEKLRERADAAEVQRRHFAFYLALAEQASASLFGPDQRRWLRQLDLDSENIVQAHAWCCAAGHDVEQGLQLTSSMRAYWVERGLTNVGIRMTLEALARPGTEKLVMPRIRALWGAADLMQRCGQYTQSWDYLTQCLALVQPLGDPVRLATVLRSLSVTAAGLGDFEAARRYGEQAVDTVRDLGQPHALGAALNELAQVARTQLDFTSAGRHYLQALRLVRRERDDIAATAVLLNLALLHVQRGRPRRAAVALRKAVRLLAELRSSPLIFAAFDCAGALFASAGNRERAATMFAAAEARMRASGQRRDALDQRALQPFLDAVAARGQDIRAHEAAREAARDMVSDVVRDDSSALQALLGWLSDPASIPPAGRAPVALGPAAD